MQLHHYVNTFGQDLQSRYGEKVHKLTIHGNFTCQNRDGSLGKGGCTFYNVASFAEESQATRPIAEQLSARKKEVIRAKRYLAYFHPYTSTYAEVEYLKAMYEDTLTQADIVEGCSMSKATVLGDFNPLVSKTM